MRLTDLFLALPLLPLLLVIIMLFRDTLRGMFGPETGIFLLIVFIIGITSWMQTARVVRGEVLALKEREFVLAAQVDRRAERADHHPAHPAERAVADHGLGDARRGERDHHRDGAVVPRPRLPARLPDLGAACCSTARTS